MSNILSPLAQSSIFVFKLLLYFNLSLNCFWRATSCHTIQRENASLKEQIESLNKELEITKEKLHTLEQAWEQTAKLGECIVYDDHFIAMG